MENIEKILSEEVEDELNDLGGLKLGSEEYKTSVDGIVKLTDRLIELKKIGVECKERVENMKNDRDSKELQLAEDRRDRLIKDCIAVAGIIIPTLVTIWGTNKSLKFEEEGTVTTIMGRGFINKLLPRK